MPEKRPKQRGVSISRDRESICKHVYDTALIRWFQLKGRLAGISSSVESKLDATLVTAVESKLNRLQSRSC